MNNLVNIYALFSPVSKKIFYVGATKQDLKQRCRGHYCKNFLPTVQSLKKLGFAPEAVLLEIVDKDYASDRETFWIETFLNNGLELENTLIGNYSFSHISISEEHAKQRRIKVNVKRTPINVKAVVKEKTLLHLTAVRNTGYQAIENF